jgi:hypothetical protein
MDIGVQTGQNIVRLMQVTIEQVSVNASKRERPRWDGRSWVRRRFLAVPCLKTSNKHKSSQSTEQE